MQQYLIALNNLEVYKFIPNKNSNQPRAALDLARVEKGEVIPYNTAPKSYLQLFGENYYWAPQYVLGDQSVKVAKNCLQKSFVTRFLNS